MTNQHRLAYVNAYRMKYAPYVVPEPTVKPYPNPFLESGPPEYTHRFDQVGSATLQPQAPQIATALTLETPLREHWGRFYLPHPAAATLGPDGRLANSVCTATVAAFDATLDSLAANDFYVVVPGTRHQNKQFHGLSTVTAVRMDNVPDVIRRRRFKHKTFVARVPAETPFAEMRPTA